ncbi:MAG: alpha/beta hydrolase [Clostridia bacterium]|nr:alpha/beta hydrolase [Clostridia bacterium]
MVKVWKVSYPAYTGKEDRNVYVYLPADYDMGEKRRYPVLYMFDGHNAFFDDHATYGKSWGLADYLDKTAAPLIVAAVECNHSPENGRLSEYSPYDFDNPHYGKFKGRGDETLDWFINTLKPYIDREFRTLKDRDHTFIMGSSMGGLMSLYAVLKYNKVFSRAACLSPSIWVSEEKLRDLIRNAPVSPDTVVYMDYGSREMNFHAGNEQRFAALGMEMLKRRIHLTQRIVPNGNHSEASWEKQLPFCIGSLLYDLDIPKE